MAKHFNLTHIYLPPVTVLQLYHTHCVLYTRNEKTETPKHHDELKVEHKIHEERIWSMIVSQEMWRREQQNCISAQKKGTCLTF